MVQRLHDYWQNVAVDDRQCRILMCSGPSGTEELCCAGIGKIMVNGSRYYTALESVSRASALSSALTIYPCQIRVHQTLTVLNSNFLQLGRSSGQPQRTVYPRRLPVNCDTDYFSRHPGTVNIDCPWAGRHRIHNLNLLIVSPTRYQ